MMRALPLPLPLLASLGLLALPACSGNATMVTSSTTGTGGSSSSAGTGTGGAGTGGAGGHFTPGQPITAPDSTWTWVPFPDAFCGDGSTTGIGVNLTKASTRVLLYLEGGGACWSDLTCNTLMTASNFNSGYSEATFEAESTDAAYLAEPGGFFDRTAAANPFKDYSYVYVPYCTGDVHAGDNVVTYGTKQAKHVGFKNMTAYLERLVPTFASADRVYIAGSSAGGFGAAFNWWQAQQAFGKIRVDLIDDSGTTMPPDIPTQYAPAQFAQWNLAATLPAGCTDCMKSLDALLGFYAKQFPKQRAALLSYTQDSVLPTFFGITTAQFTKGLDEELATYFPASGNSKYFVVNGAGHVLWFAETPQPPLPQFYPQLQAFLTKMVTDDSTWASVGP
jgi:hypothetical protein